MNSLKGEAALTVADGRQFTLVFDMEALIEAEGAYGKPLEQMMKDAQAGYLGAVRALFFGALRAKHPIITLRDATAILMHDREAVSLAMEQAAKGAFPDQPTSPVNPKGGRKPGNPPGKNSGRNGAK